MSDYYEILGVSRDATDAEIKKAYRKLSRQYHPDLVGSEADNDERIKEINAAYETLSNPEKRRMYDLGGTGAAHGGFGGFTDIFETFFSAAGGGMRGPVPRGRRGQDSLAQVTITLAEAAFGAEKEITVNTAVRCATCDGSCCAPGSAPLTCTACNGSGSVQRVARSFLGNMVTTVPCGACQGYGTIIPEPCSECAGEGRVRTRKTITVQIPAGVSDGTRMRLSGRGEAGPGGGPNADLYVEIREKAHPTLVRDGDDLFAKITLPFTAAALGTVCTLETLDGPQEVPIAAGTQSGDEVRLAGLGVGRLHRDSRGDLFVHVQVATPTDLDDAQRELLQQLAVLRGEERVEPKVEHRKEGFFSRLRDAFQG